MSTSVALPGPDPWARHFHSMEAVHMEKLRQRNAPLRCSNLEPILRELWPGPSMPFHTTFYVEEPLSQQVWQSPWSTALGDGFPPFQLWAFKWPIQRQRNQFRIWVSPSASHRGLSTAFPDTSSSFSSLVTAGGGVGRVFLFLPIPKAQSVLRGSLRHRREARQGFPRKQAEE